MNNAVAIVESKNLAQSAASAVVDLKEDIKDIKDSLHTILAVATRGADMAREAAEQGKATNGRVTMMERWKDQHEAEMKPIIVRAQQAFPVLEGLASWQSKQQEQAKERSVIKRWWKGLLATTWTSFLLAVGAVSAVAIAVQKVIELYGWPR